MKFSPKGALEKRMLNQQELWTRERMAEQEVCKNDMFLDKRIVSPLFLLSKILKLIP
jgi:hypothetical protein